MLNKNGMNRHPLSCLTSIEYDVSCGFVMYGLYHVELCFLCKKFVKSFYPKWKGSSLNAFSTCIAMII